MNILKRANRTGDKIVFYYDFGRGTGQRPSTGIFIYKNPKDQTQKNHNKQALAQPGKYEPQYGGWCAYAMGATGEKVPVDPETFKIVHGKLFLFYNKFLNNTLKSWNKYEKNLNAKADGNWAKLFNKQS